MIQVNNPYPQFFDADGDPLDNGKIYFGIKNLDPRTNPKTVYSDFAGTTPVTQPVRTQNGYLVNWSGSPITVYIDGEYSFAAYTSVDVLLISAPDSTQYNIEQRAGSLREDLASTDSGKGSELVTFKQTQAGSVARTAKAKMGELVSRADFDSDANYDAAKAEKTSHNDMVVRPTGKTNSLLSDALVSFETRALSTDSGKGATLIGTTIPGVETVQEALDKINVFGLIDQPALPGFTVPTVITGVAGTQTSSVTEYTMTKVLPSAGRPIVFIKPAANRIIIRTPVTNGGPQDYIEYEMFDWSTWMYANYPLSPKPAITHAWALHGIRAVVGGRQCIFLEQPLDDGLVSTTEFAIEMGALADTYIPEGNPSPTYKRVGYGHGGISDLSPVASFQLTVDGVAGNLSSVAVGTVIEGCNVAFAQSHRLHLLAGSRANEAIGSVAVTHIFDTRGLTVLHDHTISASGIGVNNSYSGMMPMTGCDRIKAKNGAIATLNLRDGSQVGNWAGTDRYAAWDTQNSVALLEFTLPTTTPGAPPGDFSYATSSQSFALNNTNWLSKFYINWVSGAAPIAIPALHSHQFRITVRRGLPG